LASVDLGGICCVPCCWQPVYHKREIVDTRSHNALSAGHKLGSTESCPCYGHVQQARHVAHRVLGLPTLLNGARADRPTQFVLCDLHYMVAVCAGLHCLSPLTAIGTSPSHATPLWGRPHTPSRSQRSSALRGCSARWTLRRCSLPSTTSQTRTSSTSQHRCVGRHMHAEHRAT